MVPQKISQFQKKKSEKESHISDNTITPVTSQTGAEFPQITINYESDSSSKDSVKSGTSDDQPEKRKLNRTIQKIKAGHSFLKENSSFYRK